MATPKITKADVAEANKVAPRKKKITSIQRQVMVEVEEGMNWSDLTHAQRLNVLFEHENRWRRRLNVSGAAKQAEHKLTRG